MINRPTTRWRFATRPWHDACRSAAILAVHAHRASRYIGFGSFGIAGPRSSECASKIGDRLHVWRASLVARSTDLHDGRSGQIDLRTQHPPGGGLRDIRSPCGPWKNPDRGPAKVQSESASWNPMTPRTGSADLPSMAAACRRGSPERMASLGATVTQAVVVEATWADRHRWPQVCADTARAAGRTRA